MSVFSKSKWIWASCMQAPDQYTEYKDIIAKQGSKTVLNISCDSDYTLFINDEYVASNQYGDFEHYKIYDEIDITSFLTRKENELKFLVYYCGIDTQRYKKASAGLIYEVICNDKVFAYSSKETLSRLSPAYVSGKMKRISSQLGFSFSYDATKETNDGYSASIEVNKKTSFFPRPIDKLKVLPRKKVKDIKQISNSHYLIDLGQEVVGLAQLDFYSSIEQNIEVAYGESLDSGTVRKIIADRNFSFEYKAKKGHNIFTNHMLRIAGRYLEVFTQAPIEINYIGILPQIYEVKELPYQTENKLDSDIYSICVNTLKLCMLEHYVDTPWREQCLYAFDSRNQMLCGYYCFESQNKDYARANLKLIAQDKRKDNLLSICYPCGTELAIPSFSLYYILAVKEYTAYTNDTSLAKEVMPKMKSILDEFLNNMQNGLICKMIGPNMWNFYDWSDYLDGWGEKNEKSRPDLVINCLFVLALDAYNDICTRLNEKTYRQEISNSIRERINEEFLTSKNIYTLHNGQEQFTSLGNSLAVLAKVPSKEISNIICEKISQSELISSSLSMNIWKYDALMSVDTEKYKDYILTEIRTNYKKMLEADSTTVWETINGSVDFDNAGSLCHGWSAIPIYIYNKLGLIKR